MKHLFSRSSNFRDLSRIPKLNSCEFLEFAHNHNFMRIEYQRLENTPNQNVVSFRYKKIAKLGCSENIVFYSTLVQHVAAPVLKREKELKKSEGVKDSEK